MNYRPKVFLASNVFSEQELGSNEKISEIMREKIKILWQKLLRISEVKIFDGRFPTEEQIKHIIKTFNPEILGCHLSHVISKQILENSNIFAISTSTVGYNHISKLKNDDIIISHTPGVLFEAVADFTIALIIANLRNLIDLHNYVWNNMWLIDDKWDLDQSLSSILTDKTLGIVGLGEIGKEVVKKLYPWGVKIIYYDIIHMKEFEKEYPLIEFKEEIEVIFKESDIVSLHLPLSEDTNKLINRDLLKLMKKNALLINTARGLVLNLEDLLDLLENKEIKINLALDVFPVEPIDDQTLERIKKIKKNQPQIRIMLFPHNASADANTRGKMNIIFLQNIIKIIESTSIDDLSQVHIIPEQKKQLKEKQWKIYHYWEKND